MRRLSDDQLIVAIREARARAHDAPKSEPGHWSNAWARFAREYQELMKEWRRRYPSGYSYCL
jgi:hypothetical protein